MPRSVFLAVLLFLLRLHAAHAQGGTTHVLTGRALDLQGRPVEGAVVVARSVETEVRRTALTDGEGRFTLLFPGGGGHYALRAVKLGLESDPVLVVLAPGESREATDLTMRDTPVLVEGITVQAVDSLWTPAGLDEELDGEWLARLPLNRSDLSAVASLGAGVVGLEASDSLGSGGFSVFGQRPDLNHVSVDGASFGSARGGAEGGIGLPRDAIQLTRVVTNSYDVSRGQYSGAQVSATTRGGTNRQQGSATYTLDEPHLQWEAGGSPVRGYTQHQLSGSYGGPIRRDKVFYFVSGSARHRSQDFTSLLQADAVALEQLGAHPDSVERFLSILAGHGLSAREPVPVAGQLIEELLLFGRLDFALSKRHSLVLRGDARINQRDGTRVSSLGLPHSGGNDAAGGGGGMLVLTSSFGKGVTHELRAYLSRSDSDAEPYFPVPEGRVRVASFLPDGTRSVVNLVFGGNRSLPVSSRERTLEVSDELTWRLGAAHQLKLGALLNATRSAGEFSATQYGAYTFNSLEEFATNRAASYSRSLTTSSRVGGGENIAMHLGDVWQTTRRLQLTYGLRMESSLFGTSPAYNAQVDSLFGRRTDHFPSEVDVSPRVGFTYTVPPAKRGEPTPATFRGGAGVFRGRPPFSLYSTAMDATGLPGAQVQINCVGTSVPVPDWQGFRDDPDRIPELCVGGTPAVRSSGRAPNVTVFTPDFQAPRSWRASVEVDRSLGRRYGVSLSGTYNLGTNLYGVTDLNLNAEPRFTVHAENGRPVFVEPGAVVERSGQLGMMGSRIHPEFGQVLELHSGMRSTSTQVTASLRGNVPSRLNLRASYTLASSRDQSSFSCCSAQQGFGSPSTAGNPNEPEWSTSTFERRHSVTANLGLTVRPWMEVTLIGRSSSGAPFTPLVSTDINGDGARNDRAFLFHPEATPDSAVAAGMARLLETAPGAVQQCLSRQLGRIAARNSCLGSRTSALELRSNLRPKLPGTMQRRMMASISSQNLLMGLDQLFSGSGGLRGWGQRASPDGTLLYTRGFDPVARTFRYEVNERFGNSRSRTSIGSPFQLHLEARVTLGPQQRPRGRG